MGLNTLIHTYLHKGELFELLYFPQTNTQLIWFIGIDSQNDLLGLLETLVHEDKAIGRSHV